MNARCWLVLVALATLALVAADDPKQDLRKMQGTWTIESIEKDGKELNKAQLKDRQVIIKGSRYTVKDGEKVIDRGTYKIDTSTMPRTIDISPTVGPYAGKKLLGIYQVEDDERAICFSAPGDDRPSLFKTNPNSGQVFILYKRVKR